MNELPIFSDRLESHPDGTMLQHGPYNNRIYLMKLGRDATSELPMRLIRQAREQGYSKIFTKIPRSATADFIAAGYVCEAIVPGLFNRSDDGFFMSCFLSRRRSQIADRKTLDDILRQAETCDVRPVPPLTPTFTLRLCREKEVAVMADLYRQVFPSYPFPVQDPAYLRETMRHGISYFGAFAARRLVALSSAEVDSQAEAAEMTDFAVLPEWRGHGIGYHLLARMEAAAAVRGIKTAYTIARAASFGINMIFARLGYRFEGRLVNNTNIYGGIETMNVWSKLITR